MPIRFALKTFPLLLAAAFVVLADDPSWKNKPAAQWDAQDAKQVLSDSPWAGSVTPQWVRDLSPDERRAGGDMEADRGKGVGLDGLVGIFDPARAAEAIARAHEKPDPGAVLVRWESAQPVWAAEQKVPDPAAAAVDREQYYAIVVYNILTPKRSGLERELRGIAFLRRDRKKDLKPARVMILRKDEETATVVYLFPRTVEISKRDGNLTFYAQIGRLVVTKVFSTIEMEIAGQLEL